MTTSRELRGIRKERARSILVGRMIKKEM